MKYNPLSLLVNLTCNAFAHSRYLQDSKYMVDLTSLELTCVDRDVNLILESNSICHFHTGHKTSTPFIAVHNLKDSSGAIFPKIVVNSTFKDLPIWVQESFISHEHGHIHHGFTNTKPFSIRYYDKELEADLYAISQGHDQLEALMWYMHKYPSMFDIKRIRQLADASGRDKKSLPYIYR